MSILFSRMAAAVGLGATARRLLIHSWSLPALVAVFFIPALLFAIRRRPFDVAGVGWTAAAAVFVEALALYRS